MASPRSIPLPFTVRRHGKRGNTYLLHRPSTSSNHTHNHHKTAFPRTQNHTIPHPPTKGLIKGVMSVISFTKSSISMGVFTTTLHRLAIDPQWRHHDRYHCLLPSTRKARKYLLAASPIIIIKPHTQPSQNSRSHNTKPHHIHQHNV